MNQVAIRASPPTYSSQTIASPTTRGNDGGCWSFPGDTTNALRKELLKELQWIDESYSSISPIAATEGIFLRMMLNFFEKREEFHRNGKPIGVQIGYHYTSAKAASYIASEGLQTSSAVRGSYGRGIYVGNNPHAFKSYGEIGLVVLILVGTQKKMYIHKDKNNTTGTTNDDIVNVDSFHGNKAHMTSSFSGATRYFEETVLRDNKQILPLFKFRTDLTNNSDLMQRIHASIQMMVNRLFPDGCWPASLTPVRPHFSDLCFEHRLLLCNNSKKTPTINQYTEIFAALTTASPGGAAPRHPQYKHPQFF